MRLKRFIDGRADTRPQPRPGLLRRASACALAALTLGALCATLATSAPAATGRPGYLDGGSWAVVSKVNQVRAQHGLPALRGDPRLARAAAHHSADMARRNYYAHDTMGGRPWYARLRHYLRARVLGETIGLVWGGRRSAEAGIVVRSWLRSPTHRAILLDGRMRRIGVAHVTGRRHRAFYTADFASG